MSETLALRPTPADAIDRARQHLPDLPAAGHSGRWSPKQKESVVIAIFTRRLTISDALQAYQMTEEELGSWMVGYRKAGRLGVSSTKIQVVQQRPRQDYPWRRRHG